MIQDAKKKILHFLTAKKQVLRFYFYLLVKFSSVTGAISDFVDSIRFFLHRTLVERIVINREKEKMFCDSVRAITERTGTRI